MHMTMHLATRPTPCTIGQVHILVLYIKQCTAPGIKLVIQSFTAWRESLVWEKFDEWVESVIR